MRFHWVCAVVGVPSTLLLVLIMGAGFSRPAIVSLLAQGAQPPRVGIETVYPRHVARGQTTVINVAIPSKDAVQSVEISPATGVTVSAIKGTGSETEQAVGWWQISLDVASDTAPGDRALVLVMPAGRTVPATIAVPTHVPTISDLSIVPPRPNQPTLELRLAAADAAGDLGDAPYVWFIAGCGGAPIVGAVRGTVSAGVVRAVLPNLSKAAGDGVPAAGTCDLQVRVTDATGIDSNTLKTTVPLTPVISSALVPTVSGTSSAQEWTEFASKDDRFTISFPGQPKVTETTWVSQYGAILPARIYAGTEGSGRYAVTVIDYNPIERLLSERSRTLPALDVAVHAYGLGYWKTDVRSGVIYAMSKFMERDAKMTNVMSNFADLVAGLQLQLTNNADQSRTFASVYMHANRLVIAEATLPKGYPPPLIFQQSLGWLDENGMRIRYPFMNYNEPDAPPPARGR